MSALFSIGAVVSLMPFAPGNPPQFAAQSPHAKTVASPSFEVTSIRPSRPEDLRQAVFFQPGRFIARAATIKLLIAVAYNVHPFQISGGPSWVNSKRYNILAKQSDAIAEQLRRLSPDKRSEMQAILLQSLLVGRFDLTVSHKSKELPVYTLVVATNGPKLSQSTSADKNMDIQVGQSELTAKSLSMATFTVVLANQLDRTVLDQTGLAGTYDFEVQWARSQTISGMPSDQRGSAPETEAVPPVDSSGPSFFTAIQEQLGLKLQSTKAPVDTIVIKHVESPSEN
jgi:uncharacterized protein (TIGR03435 family)